MTIRRLVCALSATLALAACGGDVGDARGASGGGSGSKGNLRLINASQTPSLDLYDGNTALANSVAQYGASGYASLSQGSRTLTLRAASNSTPLATASATVARDDHQALVAYVTGGNLATTIVPEDEPSPTADNAKLRIFNTAGVDAGAVDVYVVNTPCRDIAASATPAALSVSALQSSYAVLAASSTPYRVCVTGVGVRTDVRLDLTALLLSNQRIVTLILVRALDGTLQAVALDQQGTATTVPRA